MEQLERIAAMEERMNTVRQAMAALADALDAYEAIQPQLEALTAYYESPLWMQDYADDEAGKLPAACQRGVLSQDGLYDLLTEHTRLLAQMRILGK